MRILFYAHSSTLYGANRSLIDLILGLKSLSSELDICVIIPMDEPLGSELKRNSIKFKVIGHFNWFYNYDVSEKWKAKSKVLFKLWFLKNKFLKQFKNNFNLNAHLKFAKNFNPELIYVNSSLNPMGLIVSEKLGVNYIWHHRETVNEAIYGFYLENDIDFIKHYRRTYLHLYPSNFLETTYIKSFGESSSKVIFNGTMPDNSNPIRTFNTKKVRFGIVGRINNQKKQREVIELFSKLDLLSNISVELYIIGNGDIEFLNWLKKIQSKNIFHYEFLDRYAIYDKFDILISNASNEAFGRTIAEANYNGIPVIAMNSGAFPELIINGVNGFLYDDLKELKNSIQKISHLTPEEYLKLSELSYLHASMNFDYIKVANKVLAEIEKII